MDDQGPHPLGRYHEYFAGFHHFGGVERGLAFEVAQLPEEPPGAMYPDDVPIACVVGRADGDLAGKNDEEVVGALTFANERLTPIDGATGAACLEGGDLVVGQSRVRAVHVGGFGQRRRFALIDRGLRHSLRARSTSASSRRVRRTARSGALSSEHVRGHAAWAMNRNSRHVRTSGTTAGAAMVYRAADIPHSRSSAGCTWRIAATCGSTYTVARWSKIRR